MIQQERRGIPKLMLLYKGGRADMNNVAILYGRSVFQIPAEQRMRFNDLVKKAHILQACCVEGEQLFTGFTNLVGDVWTAFYALHPKLIPNGHEFDAMQAEFMKNLLNSSEYTRWHKLTAGDEFLSVLTAIAIADQLKSTLQNNHETHHVTAQKGMAERSQAYANHQLEQLHKKVSAEQTTQAEKDKLVKKRDLMLRREQVARSNIDQINAMLRGQVTQMNEQQIDSLITLSTKKAKQTKNDILSVGTMDGRKINQISLNDQLKLAHHIEQHQTLKKIADLAGRFRNIVQKKQKTKQRMTMERKDVTLGQEVSRLLPIELANFIAPSSKLDFLRRYGEQQTFVFDTHGKDNRGKGPIIICMDESSSMTSIKEESKAFCMALLMIARKKRRDFAIIPFASHIGEVQVFKKGRATLDELIYFSESFLGGGTNYEKPLRASLEILQKNEFNKADLLFVTDGSSFLSRSFIEEFNAMKKKKQFECTAIVLTNLFNAVDLQLVNQFSDKVIEVKDLFEAEEVFSI